MASRLHRVVTEIFLKSVPLVLWSFAVGGVVLIVFEIWHGEKKDALDEVREVPYWKAVLVGLFQAVAMVPGVSRSAVTVIGGLTLGVRRRAAVELAFLLAIPTMTAATGYELYKHRETFSAEQWQTLAVGFAASFVVALAAVAFMLRFIRTHTFIPFGVYRIVAALVFAYWLYG